jgi:vacuolar-type H+-ATPase subunit E/Vma4
MNHKIIKTSIALTLTAVVLLGSTNTQAYPPFVRQAAKFGAKDCTFCHTAPEGGEGWNKRGEWLIAEKDKRKADKIDVAWLSEYGEQATATSTAQANDKWAELEAYHDVMSQTFHPAEEGKLEPIRKRAGELAEKARQWLDSKPPKVYDSADIKTLLVKLNAESKALADAIAKGAKDEQIKKDLTALHDRFHEIIGACRDEKKKHQ